MQKKTTILIIIIAAILVLGSVLVAAAITAEQKRCLVWRQVESKGTGATPGEYYINVLPLDGEQYGLALPVDGDTYSFMKVNQSYNFYCHTSIWQNWKCQFSYECGEMG